MGFTKSNNLNEELNYIDIPNIEDAVSNFFENAVYVFSLKFLYDFLFKEWTTKNPIIK